MMNGAPHISPTPADGSRAVSGRRHGIRSRMTIGFSLVFVVILVLLETIQIVGVPFLGYKGRVGKRRTEAVRNLELIADLKKERLVQAFEEVESDINVFSTFVAMQRLVGILATSHALEQPPTAAQIVADPVVAGAVLEAEGLLTSVADEYSLYRNLTLVDAASSGVLVSTGETTSARAGFAHAVAMALQTAEPYIGEAQRDGENLVCPVATPVTDSSGTPVVVLLLTVDLEELIGPTLHTGDGLGSGGEALLVNRESRILAPLQRPLPSQETAQPLVYQIKARPARLAAEGGEGAIESRDYRNVQVLAAYRHIKVSPDWGWGLVVKRDQTELYSTIRQDVLISALLGTGAIAALIIVAMFLAGQITSPLLQLRSTARQLAAGDRSIRTGIVRADEIGDLAAAFDAMADTIESSWQAIEERSRELAVTAATLEEHREIQNRSLSIAGALAEAADLRQVLGGGLDTLMQATGCQVGAVYLAENDHLVLAHAAGCSDRRLLHHRLELGEGVVGVAATRSDTEVLGHIPADTVMTISTVAGTAIPNSIVTVPLWLGRRLVGVVTLASLYQIGDKQLTIIETSRAQLATAITNATANSETSRLAAELRRRNEELQAQAEELQAQTHELETQAEELRQVSCELRVRQAQAEEANRLKSEFLSNMSHELRTPLNSVLALSRLMIERGPGVDADTDAEHLRIIERNGRLLLNLINDILDLSKIEAGRMDLQLSRFELDGLVETVLATIAPLAAGKGLTVNRETGQAPAEMESDQEKVQQILLNLLSNAVKFTSEGSITLEVEDRGRHVCFSVTDTGIGIAEEDLSGIFEEFRQVDGSTTRQFSGTGLGLAISQRLAALLGGDLTVRSEPGAGSTFVLRLPARLHEPAAAPAPSRPAATPSRSPRQVDEPATVLLIEDNEPAAMQIRYMLEEAGYEVGVAADGRQGLDLVQTTRPDGIILDLMMPGLDGFRVLEQIRSMPGLEDLPVLILTAKELTSDERRHLRRNNVTELIQKGRVDRSRLLEAVARLTGRQHRQEQAPAPVRGTPSSASSGPVLVVEDNPDNLATVSAVLGSLGRPLVVARDAQEALAQARGTRPSLILMDLQLPKMGGAEVLKLLRQDAELSSTPVVALTAKAMRGDRQRALDAGFDDYLTKPIDAREVAAVLERWAPENEVGDDGTGVAEGPRGRTT